jgi:hypothetical protein
MRNLCILLVCTLIAGMVCVRTADADTIDQQFENFFQQQAEFDARAKREREEGYMLQRLYDPKGESAGALSLGGGPDPEPQFGFSRRHNFTGRRFDEDENEPARGILNLQLRF